MGIKDITFAGLIQNRPLSSVTGPEFINALNKVGWREGTGTHFFRELRKDGPTCGVTTLGILAAQISRGKVAPAGDGKTQLWICNGAAYIIFNQTTRTLITFSRGQPKR